MRSTDRERHDVVYVASTIATICEVAAAERASLPAAKQASDISLRGIAIAVSLATYGLGVPTGGAVAADAASAAVGLGVSTEWACPRHTAVLALSEWAYACPFAIPISEALGAALLAGPDRDTTV
jgi:hypothetical protein